MELRPPADSPAASSSLEGYTLVVPALGLGNVCQLAVDLVVNTALVLREVEGGGVVARAGHLATPHVAPTVGTAPYSVPITTTGGGGGDVALNCEVYVVPEARVAVLQQRAACCDREHELYVAALASWAASARLARVLLLAGTDAILRPERMARGDRLVYLSTATGGLDAAAAAAGATRYVPPTAAGGSDEDRAALALHVERARATAAAAAAGAGVTGRGIAAAGSGVPSYYTGGAWLADVVGGGTAVSGDTTLPGWEAPSPAAIAATADAFAALWGTGYAPVYYRRWLSSPAAPPLTLLALFMAEGDNLADAAALATAAAAYTGIAPVLARLPPAVTHTLAQDDGTGAKKRRKGKAAAAGGGGGGAAAAAVAKRTWPATNGLVVPAYFLALFGPPPDLRAGSYGF